MERLFNLVAINERSGKKTVLTAYPDTHAACVTMKGKFIAHRDVRIQLEEVAPTPCRDTMIAESRLRAARLRERYPVSTRTLTAFCLDSRISRKPVEGHYRNYMPCSDDPATFEAAFVAIRAENLRSQNWLHAQRAADASRVDRLLAMRPVSGSDESALRRNAVKFYRYAFSLSRARANGRV